MNAPSSVRPDKSEYAEYFDNYIGRVPDGDIVENLNAQISVLQSTLGAVPESEADRLHPPRTWTIKQVVGHLIDVERVFGYRALRFASGDDQSLPGMDQDRWVEETDYTTPSLDDLTRELEYTRKANVYFFRRLPSPAWDRGGVADGRKMTVRALAFVLAGHVTHHLEIIQDRVHSNR